ncbi:YdcF family protein [Nitrincola sp.]|uniref:YdcF family protein n=1 Tax=Nitrincola sp. TaxID=1926584 RepID=UPI003A9421E4
MMINLLKYLLLPPALQALTVLFGLLLIGLGRRFLGGLLVFFAGLSLWLLGLPVISYSLQQSLEHFPPVSMEAVSSAEVIVVLGGGRAFDGAEYGWPDAPSEQTISRLAYSAFLQRQSGLPILLTGGRVYGEEYSEAELMQWLLKSGFDLSADWVEDRSRNTYENAAYSAEMLRQAGLSQVVLVSQAWHLNRAVPVFEAQGLQVLPAPIQFATPPPEGLVSWLPTSYHFRQSSQALHEWLGLFVYRLMKHI